MSEEGNNYASYHVDGRDIGDMDISDGEVRERKSRRRSRSRSSSRSKKARSKGSSQPKEKASSSRQKGEAATKPAKQSRWHSEMARGKAERRDGKVHGYGSWYQRQPHDYSHSEFVAKQGHPDRVRTADCDPVDKLYREEQDDDSAKSSDWRERTAIDPEQFWAQKAVERENKKKRDLEKKIKDRQAKGLIPK